MQLRDFRESGYGCEADSLHKSASAAASAGEPYYFTGKTCRHGHTSPRYTAGGGCVQCTRERNIRKRGSGNAAIGKRAVANLTRAIAARDGSTTYVPAAPCLHGHLLRFTASNNCVECDEATRIKRKMRAREARLLKLYGLDFTAVDELLRQQGGACAICKDQITRSTLHVDHCHGGGHVRGLLCQRCNQAIGLLRDNPEIIRSAARYVENA